MSCGASAPDHRFKAGMSRDKFADLSPALDRARGTALDTPLGSLLGDYLVLLEQTLPDVAPDDQPRICDAIGAMVAACLSPEQDRAGAAGLQIDTVRLERVHRVVRKYLRSPALGARLLCHSLSMSRSKLYRLMDAEGGVARYIQRQRLLEAYALLSDQSVNRSPSPESFALPTRRLQPRFRREFAASPSDVRATRAASVPSMAPAQGSGGATRGICTPCCAPSDSEVTAPGSSGARYGPSTPKRLRRWFPFHRSSA
jgi:AraC-like DNA-binding protein